MPSRFLLIVLLFFFACGKKGAPNPPDRFATNLDELKVTDGNHLELDFSEEIDTFVLALDNFQILDVQKETLAIFAIYPFLNNSQIVLATALQDSVTYHLIGSVRDAAGNLGEIDEQFTGRKIRDTMPPTIVDFPTQVKVGKVFLKFSEAMDTSFLRGALIPKPPKNFLTRWDKGLRQVDFYPAADKDTLVRNTVYYLYLDRARDLAGNSIKPFRIYFTLDSLLPKWTLSGTVYLGDSLIDGALIVARAGGPIVALAIAEHGKYTMVVTKDIEYTLEAFFDGYHSTGVGVVGKDSQLKLVEEKTPSYEDIFR